MLDIWQRVRDMELQWPWCDDRAAAARLVDPDIQALKLHGRMLGILRNPRSYADACGAALSIDALGLLAASPVATAVLVRAGDPKYPSPDRLPRAATPIEVERGAEAPQQAILAALGL